ncbi:unnamed protein product, partial [Dovyalis caffra]
SSFAKIPTSNPVSQWNYDDDDLPNSSHPLSRISASNPLPLPTSEIPSIASSPIGPLS